MTEAVFQPEQIELMKSVLEEAAAMLPEAKRTSTVEADIACEILKCAAAQERGPTVLKSVALSAVAASLHAIRTISRKIGGLCDRAPAWPARRPHCRCPEMAPA